MTDENAAKRKVGRPSRRKPKAVAPDADLLSRDQAARRLGIGMTLLDALISSGAIKAVRIGRRVLIPVEAYRAYVAALKGEGTQ